MATVSALVDYICDVLKFAKGSSGSPTTERTVAVRCLNIVYPEIVNDCQVNEKLLSVTVPVGTQDMVIGTAPFSTSDVLVFNQLFLTDGSNSQIPLSQVTPAQLRGMRQGVQAAASPYVYCVMWPNFYLYPAPSTIATLSGEYVAMPKTLNETVADATNETTPTAIHAAHHYSALANSALVKAFEFDDPGGLMGQYKQLADEGKAKLTRWSQRVGGIEPAPWYSPGSGGPLQSVPSQDMGY